MILKLPAAAIALSLLAAPVSAAPASPARPAATTTFAVDCRSGDRIPAAERAALEARALESLALLQRGDADAVYALLPPDLRGQIDRAPYAEVVRWLREDVKLSGPRVTAVYALDVQGKPPEPTTACDGPDGSPVAYPGISDAPSQAHVLIEAREEDGNVWTMATWLRRQDGQWWVVGFDTRNSAAGALDSAALLARGRQARDAGDVFEAKLLYRFALTLSDRGRNFAVPIRTEIADEMEQTWEGLSKEGVLQHHWSDGQVAYAAHDASLAGDAEGLYLVLYRLEGIWTGARDVDRANRALIKSYMKKHPRWASRFEGVFVETLHPDGATTQITWYVEGEGWSEAPK